MKKIIPFFIVLMTLAACNQTTIEPRPDYSSTDPIAMDITSVRNFEFDLIVTNHSNETVLTGYPYTIEHLNNSVWETVPSELDFILPGISVEPHGSHAQRINLSDYFGTWSYHPGIYRIIKFIMVEDDEIKAFAEFEIQ